MKSKFSEQELKERALELLYGLLEEDEAEELRLLIASDATAARIFDEARETVDRFARAARWEETPETEVDETAAKNVALESAPFDVAAAFLFGSAFGGSDAFSATVDDAKTAAFPKSTALESDGESSGSNRKRAKRRLNLLRKNKTESKKDRSEKGGDADKRGEARKERRRAKAEKSANFAKTAKASKSARPAFASRFRFGSKGRVDGESGWATVGRTRTSGVDGGRRSAARRLWARVPKPTLFQNLIIALALVALSTAVGFWAQESALQARFRDDFRIQIAAPRTLARGESQTIAATTTGPNGKPRRVPIRFSFSDAETGAPLLAHTESGDASGVARFKIPDVSDFPARTLLTISAGEREKETFETTLTVVDAPKTDVRANAAARFAASEAVEKNGDEILASKKERPEKAKIKYFQSKASRTPDDGTKYMSISASPTPDGKAGAMTSGMDASPTPDGGTTGMAMNAAPVPDGKMGVMGGMGASPTPDGGTTGMAMNAAPDPDGNIGFADAVSITALMNAAPDPDGNMEAMGGMDASPTSGGGTTRLAMNACSTPSAPVAAPSLAAESEAASEETRMETPALADQDSPKFDRARVELYGALRLRDESGRAPAEASRPLASGDKDAKNGKKGKSEETAVAAPTDDFGRAVAEMENALALSAESDADVRFNFSDGANGAIRAPEKRGLDVRFYPTGGRLVAGRENVVWFECVDEVGRPVVGEFALNDSKGRVATAKTSEGGVGTLRWTPDADETYSLETAFNGKIAKAVEVGKIVKNDKKKVGEEERVAADAAPGMFALNDDVRVQDFLTPEPTFETFRFAAPTATVERVAFSVPSQVLESGKGVELEIWAENGIPLAATVEKNGVALAQRVWTAEKGRRRVVVPLDANASGALNVSLWNCARTPFEKVGSTAVYRKPAAGASTLAASLERDDAGKRALRVAVDSKKGLGSAEKVRLEAFWAATLDAGVAALDVDETLLYASDERRVETLATLALPEAAPPVLFDNLLEMKARALQKLNAFWLGEAGLAGRVVGFGFVGCAALAALTVFCVVFGALKARRGAVVVLFCAALATFFYFERRRIDFSETLSEAIAVSVDESRAAQKEANDGGANAAFKATVANGGAQKTAAIVGASRLTSVPLPLKNATKPANEAEWSVPLTGPLATTDVGFILTKVVADGETRAWKAVPLAEIDGGGENAGR